MNYTKSYYWILVTIFIFALDRVAKILVIWHLPFEQAVSILPSFNLFFTFNSGAAFSFLKEANGWQEWLFGGIATFVSIFVIIWQTKIVAKHAWLKIALAFVLGGTLGNLYDRIFYHQVVDFIDFYFRTWHFPAFNVADAAICIGAIMLIVDVTCMDNFTK